MSKTVDFYLGPVYTALASRQLTITRMPKAGDDTMPSATYNADEGATAETAQATLPDNQIWEAKLVDTLDGGEVSVPQTIKFHTGELQFPGKKTNDGTAFQILSMEDNSSSSSSSSNSSSSSSSSDSSSLNSSSSSSSSESSSSSSSSA